MTGYEQLMKIGEQRGMEKGMSLMQRRIIETGHQKGMTISLMAELTGLPEEEVQKMIDEKMKEEN